MKASADVDDSDRKLDSISKIFDFIQDFDSMQIKKRLGLAIAQEAHWLYNKWEKNSMAQGVPQSVVFSDVTTNQRDELRALLYERYPFIHLCDLHWKVDKIGIKMYHSWNSSNKKKKGKEITKGCVSDSDNDIEEVECLEPPKKKIKVTKAHSGSSSMKKVIKHSRSTAVPSAAAIPSTAAVPSAVPSAATSAAPSTVLSAATSSAAASSAAASSAAISSAAVSSASASLSASVVLSQKTSRVISPSDEISADKDILTHLRNSFTQSGLSIEDQRINTTSNTGREGIDVEWVLLCLSTVKLLY